MFEKFWPYVLEKKPSPYLLEYIYNLFAMVILDAILIIGLLIISMLKMIPYIFGFGLLVISTMGALTWYFLISDRPGWLYILDKQKNRTMMVHGQLWDFPDEIVGSVKQTGRYGVDPNKIYLFYQDDLNACRVQLYFRQQGEDVYPRGRVGFYERSLETKSGKPLQYVRMVMTTPKQEIMEKYLDIYPPLEVEMVCWKRSKILIEFRPMEGLEYPPEALECFKAMNAMYP